MPGIHGVHVLGSKSQVHILWDVNGVITAVEPCQQGPNVLRPTVEDASCGEVAPMGLDGQGALVLPGFADMHTHLDKTGTAGQFSPQAETLSGAVKAFAEVRNSLTPESVYVRALTAAKRCADYGTTLLRTHIDSYYPDQARLAGVLTAIVAVKGQVRDSLDLEMVLMCPTVPDPVWAQGLCQIAPQLAALGGAPGLAPDPARNLRWILDQAEEYALPVDLHVDETLDPDANLLELLADEVARRRFPFPVTAAHVVSLASQPLADQRRVARKVGDMGIHIVSLPQTNCYLQGREKFGQGQRGLTALAAFQEAGVDVAFASDNMEDPFHPWGNGDLLQVASLALYAGHMGYGDSEKVLRAIAEIPGQFARGAGYGLRPGNPAEMVVLRASSAHEAMARLPAERAVIRQGKLIHVRGLTRRSALS